MTSHESPSRPVYEHPWAVRLCHWTTAVAITILTHERTQNLERVSELRTEDPRARPDRGGAQGDDAGRLARGRAAGGISRSCGSLPPEVCCT